MTVTNAETAAIARDVGLAIEAAVSSQPLPRTSIRDARLQLRALLEEEEESTEARQFIYGYTRVETVVVFREIDSRGRLHLVAAVSGDEVEEIAFWEIDGTIVHLPVQTDNHGNVDGPDGLGRFLGVARLQERLGKPGQSVLPNLRHETSVDSNFVGTGIAYLYGRFTFKEGVFDGDPPLRAVVRGRKPIDPRDGIQRWTINPIVQAYDLLVKAKAIGGAGRSDEEIDLASWQAAADDAETLIEAKTFTRTSRFTNFTANQLIFLDSTVLDFQYGDVVQISAGAGQSLPGGLSANTDYHVIPRFFRVNDIGEIGFPSIRLAATFEDAMAENSLTFSPTTALTVKKVKEVRFACSGSYRGRFTTEVLEKILATAGAKVTLRQGKIAVVPAVFPDEVKTLSISDIEGNLTLSNKVGLEDRTTELTGTFISPTRLFQADDYPKVGSELFEEQDGGSYPQRLELEFCPKPSTAQRVAGIELAKRRQEKQLSFAALMRRYDIEAGDVFSLDYSRLGLDSNTPFQCLSRRIFVEIQDGAPRFRLDFTARQLEETTFDPDITAEKLITASKLPDVVNPYVVKAPSQPQISEGLFETVEGAGVRVVVTMAWESAEEPFFSIYQPQYKLSSETAYRNLARTTDLTIDIFDLGPGTYDFRVITINTLNLESDPAENAGVTIRGLTATPATPTGFTGQVVGTTALLQWDRHPDLDVRIGGKIEIRHHSDVAGGNAANSILLAGGEVNGDATFTQVAALVGTYYIRAFDQLGIASGFVEWSTDNVRPVPFAQIISGGAFQTNDSNEDQVTIAEAPAWASTNPDNTVEVDLVTDVIRLPAAEQISDQALFSAIPLVSAVGGLSGVASEAVYHFFTRLELAAATRMRIEVELATEVTNPEDQFSERGGNVSDFLSFSGIIDPSVCNAFMEARFTRDDPNASPVWSDWERVESRVFFHRAIEFRVQLRSFDPVFNIEVSQASIRARELAASD